MAQDTRETPRTTGTPTAPDDERPTQFHYYSGGEIKEMENTPVSMTLIVFWSVVIVGAVLFFLFGGALGPKFGGYQPVGASAAGKAQVQQALDVRGGGIQMTTLNLNYLPLPAGVTLSQAIQRGTDIYQTNCIGCHGPNQDGNGVNAGSLNPKPRNLHDGPFMQAMSYQRINTSIHKGVPGTAMPRWENTLTEDQIKEVIAYVFSLTAPPAAQGGVAQSTKSLNGSTTGNAGGSNTYVNGVQNSPAPITPPVGGNPAAPTNTAPPSMGSGASPVQAINPMAGGQSKNPPFRPNAAAPVPGSPAPSASTANPPAGRSGM